MFGLDWWVWAPVLVIALIYKGLPAWKEFQRHQGKKVSFGKEDRHCLICQYEGRMKTWLGNYIAPQLVALLGLIFFLVPGIIFILLFSNKYKCPDCGALGKNRLAGQRSL